MKILIVSINSKNIHKSPAPWYLKAACKAQTDILECSVNESPSEILVQICAHKADVIAFSCYIWNIECVKKTGAALRSLLPECVIILGGPEVSFETSLCQYPFSNYIIKGAGEAAFAKCVQALEAGKPLPDGILWEPYADFASSPCIYTDEYFASFEKGKMRSIKNQLIYYESSRGCPFSCSFCLSSREDGVEYLPVERVKGELSLLISHGAKCIKFVDRTFNANQKRALEILEWIKALDTECTFHFEAAADLFSEEILSLCGQMPAGRVQFEIGIQSVNPETLDAVMRKTDAGKVLKNIKRLAATNRCHIHADLIAGLPFETMGTFSKAVNACFESGAHMVQIGFLKLLKGSAIRGEGGCIYTPYPPYEVLQTDTMSFEELAALRHISALADKYYNSGMFAHSLLFARSVCKDWYSFWTSFSEFAGGAAIYKSSLKNAYTLLFDFLSAHADRETATHYIKLDCLQSDSKGILPDAIAPMRDREAEAEMVKTRRERGLESVKIRGEYFPYDGSRRVFVYEKKHPVTGRYSEILL